MLQRLGVMFFCGILCLCPLIPLWASIPSPSLERLNRQEIMFMPIPSGQFAMGQTYFEEPVHQVKISRFYLAKYETTYRLWSKVYRWAVDHGYDFDNPGNPGYQPQGDRDLNPVAGVNWYDVVKWCNALSEMEGKTLCYYEDNVHGKPYRTGHQPVKNECVKWMANGYRLPTEAEWEYAERAGTSTLFIWGDSYRGFDQYAYVFKSGPVGSKLPNRWGLYDIVGNVEEWCWDWAGSYPKKNPDNPVGPAEGSLRILRGSTCCYINLLYSAHRSGNTPSMALKDYGFRVACQDR